VGIEKTTDSGVEELYRVHGYILEIVPGNRIEVMVMEGQTPKKLLMPIKPFEEQGILGQDMRFVYRVYRKDGQVYSEVIPDDSEGRGMPSVDSETLRMLEELGGIEAKARAGVR